MNTGYLKALFLLGLLFVFQGCSLYAGFSVKEKTSPEQAISSSETGHSQDTLKSEGQVRNRT